MVRKIGISLTKEIDRVLEDLVEEMNLPKSRLIETYLREHPLIKKKLSEYRLVEVVYCSLCDSPLGPNQVKVDTPKYGVLCLDCWSKKIGEFVEEHPISNRESYSQS